MPDRLPSERLLAYIWQRQRLHLARLITRDGQPIQVIYPGRPNPGAGPDFLGALIALPDGTLLAGAVELHVRADGWRQHGHAGDPRYEQVVLHVVYRDAPHPSGPHPPAPSPQLGRGGVRATSQGEYAEDLRPKQPAAPPGSAPSASTSPSPACGRGGRGVRGQGASAETFLTLALEDALAAPLDQLEGELERLREAPCRSWPARSPEAARALLVEAGLARLHERAAALEANAAASSPAQAVYTALLDGLGYGGDRRPYRWLAERLPLAHLLGVSQGKPETDTLREALLLGAAGFLPTQRGVAVPDAYAGELARLWSRYAALVPEPLRAPQWSLFRLRPANWPPRRLAGLARLLPNVLPDATAPPIGEWFGGAIREMEARLVVRATGYWATRADFAQPLPGRPLALVGPGRARELAINVLLPVALAFGTRAERQAAEAFYLAYPDAPPNRLTRATAQRLYGGPPPRSPGACAQQGLIHLYRRYCQPLGCPPCALSEA